MLSHIWTRHQYMCGNPYKHTQYHSTAKNKEIENRNNNFYIYGQIYTQNHIMHKHTTCLNTNVNLLI